MGGYADTLYTMLLGWVRSFVDWLWAMFDSGGSHGLWPWFSAHWLGVLIALITIGILADFLVWMIRWRPYKLWFSGLRRLLRKGETGGKPAVAIIAAGQPTDEGYYEDEMDLFDPVPLGELKETFGDTEQVEADEWDEDNHSQAEQAAIFQRPQPEDVDEDLLEDASEEETYFEEEPFEEEYIEEEYIEEEHEDAYDDEYEEDLEDVLADDLEDDFEDDLEADLGDAHEDDLEDDPGDASIYDPLASYDDPAAIAYHAHPNLPHIDTPASAEFAEELSPPPPAVPEARYGRPGLWPGLMHHSPIEQAEDTPPTRRRRRDRWLAARQTAGQPSDEQFYEKNVEDSNTYWAEEAEASPTPEEPTVVIPRRSNRRRTENSDGVLRTVTGEPAKRRGFMRFTANEEEAIPGLPPLMPHEDAYHAPALPPEEDEGE